jgi:hypothetical protein
MGFMRSRSGLDSIYGYEGYERESRNSEQEASEGSVHQHSTFLNEGANEQTP